MTSISRQDYLHLLTKEKPAKQSKYRNKPTEIDGIRFSSQKEARRYIDLRLLEKDGQIKNLSLQPRFDFPPGFFYKADFRYWDIVKNKWMIEDVKGFKTRTFILKQKCFKYFYPDFELILI